jgi:hypothetical protein
MSARHPFRIYSVLAALVLLTSIASAADKQAPASAQSAQSGDDVETRGLPRVDAQFPKLLRMDGPPAAVPVGPNAGVALASPFVRFQWQSDASQTPSVRYEICVRPLNQGCADPSAVIFRLTGTPLREPLPPARVNIGPKPGEPGFQRPAGGPGTPPFFYQVQLPIQFQGRDRRINSAANSEGPVGTPQSGA